MKETPQPKLRVSRVEADKEIQARIEKGQLLRNRQISNDESDNAIRECKEWSKYNKHLLSRLFDNDSIAEDEYVDFYYHRNLSVDPDWTPPWNLSNYQEGMDKSISSLEGIHERFELFDDPSNTPQDNFSNKMEEKTQPKLHVNRAEVDKKIQAQIEEGQLLRDQPISSDIELYRVSMEAKKWSEYNTDLLIKLFDDPALADEYESFSNQAYLIATGPHGPEWLQSQLNKYQTDMASSINSLEGIRKRLGLFDKPSDLPQHPLSNKGISVDNSPFLRGKAVSDNPSRISGNKAVSDNPPRTSNNNVFIVHGHDNEAKETVARFVEKLGIKPTILHEQANKGQTIIEKFEEHAGKAGFAIVLLTPDDVGAPKDEPNEPNPRARQNVILELGYFLRGLGRERVCVLYKEGVELPSDMHGILYVPMNHPNEWHLQLAKEMKQAGLPVDLNKLA